MPSYLPEINEAFDRYEKMKLLEKLGSIAENRYFPDEDKKLDIMLKKRALGLPLDSQDYEDATNQNKSFYSQIAPSLTKHGLQAIPGPSLLSGAKAPPSEPLFKVATFVDDLLPSVMKTSTKRAANGGSRIARIFLGL